jgi:hypothetical protein
MSAPLPRRGPHRRAAAWQADARLRRLAAVLAALTCALLTSGAVVPAAFAAVLPDGSASAAGVPATATAQQPSSPATASPCSEVCSGGGYASGTSNTTQPAYSIPIILNYLGNQGNPGPCSEVCSGGGYGLGAGTPGPCSEVCSGGGYGLVSQPSRMPDASSAYRAARTPPAAVRVVSPSDGFSWGDAGIGAGGMLALTVIGLGGALTITHRRNQRIHD